jgi:hypothetical protein
MARNTRIRINRLNIFYVDSDPLLAAQALCNKHVVKQILESAQILCTVHRYYNSDPRPSMYENVKFYKSTHVHHPVIRWCQENLANYNWLAQHATDLCKEYTYRYNKKHQSQNIITLCGLFYPLGIKIGVPQTKPALAMPNEYKDEDPVKAYRRYYTEYKRNTIQMKWTKRNPPEWWNNEDSNIRNI